MDEEITIEQARPMLQLGDKAPDFKAVTTHGPISLSDYNGQWVILFSHPADWKPGDAAIVPPPATQQEAQKRLSEGYDCKDWYFCKKDI